MRVAISPARENPAAGERHREKGTFIMHPGMLHWWKTAHRAGEASAHCGAGWGGGFGRHEGPHHDRHEAAGEHHGDLGGGAFGVRRPLRFLAFKLDLSEKQVEDFARILGDLKIERAQAAVDDRRVLGAIADMVSAESFDPSKATGVAGDRVKSAERLRDAVVSALARIHAVLEPPQRERLAYLIRTGALIF